jgi:hypothetical protein
MAAVSGALNASPSATALTIKTILLSVMGDLIGFYVLNPEIEVLTFNNLLDIA